MHIAIIYEMREIPTAATNDYDTLLENSLCY